ncbi:MAG: CocE/NonD family hydrolase, partial [Actinomycetota bacterium]
ATGGERVRLPFGPSVGTASGNWCPPPPAHGLPADQRPDDARSAAFDSDPLAEALEVLGQPVATLRVSHPGPSAIVSVKLSDVAPDGEAQLVTTGVLNLAHRKSSEHPEPFEGEEEVRIELLATGWRFLPGHRVRVAIAGADWPTVWPLPTTEPPELHLSGPGGDCRIDLPGVPEDMQPFEPEGTLKQRGIDQGWDDGSERSRWEIVTDTLAGTEGIRATDGWRSRSPDRTLRSREFRRYEAFVREADPLGADVNGEATFTLERPDVSVRSHAKGSFTATAEEFRYDIRLTVREDGTIIHRNRWRGSVPRRLC